MSMLLAIGSGSSPRVRGSRSAAQSLQRSDGIIPAGAGLTCTSCTHGTRQRDHPRGCGAHIVSHDMLTIKPGSSPRVRGSRVERIEVISVPGIIPAGAGLTNDKGHRMLPDGDHPRGCGAHTKKSQQLRHSLLLWLPESFTFKYSYRISHLVYSFVSAAT